MSDIRNPRRTDDPHSRTTRMAAWLCDQLGGHHEALDGDKVIVMIHGADEDGGVAFNGYEADSAAQDDMILFVRAVFEARGATFHVVKMRSGPNRPDAS